MQHYFQKVEFKCTLRQWGIVGRGLGIWCDTRNMRHPRSKANFKGVWRGLASPAWLGQVY
ncbi:hypothetical protein Hanom_Chr07g00660961 [Helianthus anomalus]